MLLVLSTNAILAKQNTLHEGQNNTEHSYATVSNDSLAQLIDLSEKYWSLDRDRYRFREKSDSLITLIFHIIPNMQSVDSINLANAYHMLGKVLNKNKELRLGINALKKSLVIKENVIPDDYESQATTLNYLGIVYFNLQNDDSAIYYYDRSKELLNANNIIDKNLYYAYLNTGMCISRLGQYSDAVNHFDTALSIINENEGLIDSLDVAFLYNNLALNTVSTGKLKEAIEYFEKAEAIIINKFGSFNGFIAGINNNKGENSYLNYEFLKAELYYKKAIEIYSATNPKSKDIPLIYYNLSQISIDLDNYVSSIDYCLSGLDNSPDNDMRLILNESIARSYVEIGDNEKANHYFQTALALLNTENINPKRYQELYASYADFLATIKDYSLSSIYYNKALQSADSYYGSNSKQYGIILSKIGNFYLENKENADSAIDYFSRSISIFDTLVADADRLNINMLLKEEAQVGYASSLMLKFQRTKDIDLLFEADTIFSNVFDEMEEISNGLSNNDKLLVIEMLNPMFNKAIENSSLLFNLTKNIKFNEEILNYTERSKSSALLSVVKGEQALKTSDIPDNTFRYEHGLKDEINGISQLLEKEKTKDTPDNKKLNYFETKLLIVMNRYDSLIASIEENYPKYYSVKYGGEVITQEQIKQNLDQNEALIEYQINDSILYIIAITNDEFIVKKLAIDSNFYKALEYIISIKNVDLNEQNINEFNEFKYNSYKLYSVLIKPVDKLLGNKRLIIIPDGLLGYLPFDLLIEYDFVSENINYRDLPYLITKHPISYSYSATLKYNSFFDANRNKSNNNTLAFAPIYSDNNNPSDSIAGQLDDLPFAKTEVLSIINDQEGTAYYDSDATKSNFLKHAESNDILHLAMHTIINDSLPMQSKLVFYDDINDSTSNYMYTHEIFNMDLNASMVTLSACNTGSGKFRKGEGIMSLARGFVYAGVPAIVMTLWEVQDASGSIVMQKYYQYLKDGMTKDVALQKAKLFVLKDANMARAHPFFWSAYIINGDTTPIKILSRSNYWVLAISLVSILLIVSGYLYRIRANQDKDNH